MKERESDVSQDLDAGWDDIEADVTSVSVKTQAAEEVVEVAELDAGWDLAEPAPEFVPSRQKEKRNAKSLQQSMANPGALSNPEPPFVPPLTKKARRELDRQNQIHAAKRKSEAKALRKQQRIANMNQPAEPTQSSEAAPTQPRTPATTNRNKKSSPKRRRPIQPKLNPQPVTRVSSEPSDIQRDLDRGRKSNPSTYAGKIASNSRGVLSTETQAAQLKKWRWWALGIALLVVLWVVARWALSVPK